jgi:hypothetical protein
MELTLQKRDLANHKYQGYKEIEHHEMVCSQCEGLLGGILQVKKTNGSKHYRAKCYKCDDYSYPIEVEGVAIVAEAEGLVLINLKWDGDLCTLYVKEKLDGKV